MNYFVFLVFYAQKLCKKVGHIVSRGMLTEAEKLANWNNGGAKTFFRWCRRQKQTEQYTFERNDTVPISVLGFDSIDEVVESVVDGLVGGRARGGKPCLFREDEI